MHAQDARSAGLIATAGVEFLFDPALAKLPDTLGVEHPAIAEQGDGRVHEVASVAGAQFGGERHIQTWAFPGFNP